MTVHPEVAAVGGYAAALLLAAYLLDRLAMHSHRRADRYRTAGFRYHPEHDAWACPQEQWLWPVDHDEQRRLVWYRAAADTCNACPVKPDCTSSPHGRELVRALEPWPASEAGRFHRGIALLLVALAALLLAVEAVRHHRPTELAVLAAVLALAVMVAYRLTDHLRRSPAGFPVAVPSAAVPSSPVGGRPRGAAPPAGGPQEGRRWQRGDQERLFDG